MRFSVVMKIVTMISLITISFYGSLSSISADHQIFGFLMPTWSPDGKHIAFVAIDAEYSHLYMIELDSSAVTNLTPNFTGRIISSVGWSPDGEGIAFASSRGGDSDIWFVPVSGGEFINLTEGIELPAGHPNWSPDGNAIVFLIDTLNRLIRFEIWMMDRDGRNSKQLISGNGCFTSPQWSTSGDGLVINSCTPGDEGLWIFNFERDELEQIYDGDVIEYDIWSKEPLIAMTTDFWGTEIQLLSNVQEVPPIIINIAETQVFPGINILNLGWSPRDISLVFSTHCNPGEAIMIWSEELINVTDCNNGTISTLPVWSPDGSTIAYQSDISGRDDIWLYDIETGEHVNLTERL